MTPAAEHGDLDDDKLLPACPRCGYSLHGLPVQHRCPECGLEVDRRWQVFGGRSVSRVLIWINRGLAFFGIGLMAIGLFLIAGGGRRLRDMLPFLIGPVFCIWGAWRLVRNPTCFIGVGPEGVFVYRGRRSTRYPWTNVRDAYLVTFRAQLAIETTEGEVRLPLNEFFGGTGGVDAQRCVQAIEFEALERNDSEG